MFTDITYSANEIIRECLGDELFFSVVDVTSLLYPYHCKIIGKLTVHDSISKEPLKAIAYSTPKAEEDDQYIVDELDEEHFFQGLVYEDVFDKHLEMSGEPPLFEAMYISIDPIIWDLLPPQLMYKGVKYHKYMDHSGSVNYVNLGREYTRVLFAESKKDKSPAEKVTEKHFKEFNNTQEGIVSTQIGSEIDCLIKLLEDKEFFSATKKHVELFVESILGVENDKS